MRPGWAQRRQRCDVGRGQRDVQYKWAYVMHQWDDLNRSELFSARRPRIDPTLSGVRGPLDTDAVGLYFRPELGVELNGGGQSVLLRRKACLGTLRSDLDALDG